MKRLPNGLTPAQDAAFDKLALAIAAHVAECADSTRCSFCAESESRPACEVCGDGVPAGEGCRHDGHVWCSWCFLEKCGECRADAQDALGDEFVRGDY